MYYAISFFSPQFLSVNISRLKGKCLCLKAAVISDTTEKKRSLTILLKKFWQPLSHELSRDPKNHVHNPTQNMCNFPCININTPFGFLLICVMIVR